MLKAGYYRVRLSYINDHLSVRLSYVLFVELSYVLNGGLSYNLGVGNVDKCLPWTELFNVNK